MNRTPLHALHALGQSVWYDNIRRALLTSGDLARYVDEYAVSGVTSNPTIFERAIAGGGDYDDALRDAIARGVDDPEALFWDLAVSDISGRRRRVGRRVRGCEGGRRVRLARVAAAVVA